MFMLIRTHHELDAAIIKVRKNPACTKKEGGGGGIVLINEVPVCINMCAKVLFLHLENKQNCLFITFAASFLNSYYKGLEVERYIQT